MCVFDARDDVTIGGACNVRRFNLFIIFIYTIFKEGNAFNCYSYSKLRPSVQTFTYIQILNLYNENLIKHHKKQQLISQLN